jgi:hypothetical protein
MKFPGQTRRVGLLLILTALFFDVNATANDHSFTAAPDGPSFHETVLSFKEQLESLNGHEFSPVAAAVPKDIEHSRAAVSGARTYEFKTLYSQLGYPDPGYFGASPEEIRDLATYTNQIVADSYYRDINSYLRFYPEPYEWRTINPQQADAIVQNLDRLFTRVPPLPGDLILFRGLTLKFRGNRSYGVNEEFIEKSYASTTTSYLVARHFATLFTPITDTTTLKAIFAIYNNHPGERGILINQEEDEVILRHGIQFRVMGRKEIGQKFDFYLIQACSNPCETFTRRDVEDFWTNFKTK